MCIPTKDGPVSLDVSGINHIAHVTWCPGETYRFYSEILRFPLVHAITATGWISEEFPDFVHFFFEIGNRNLLAFFFYFGLPKEASQGDIMHRSRHIAFHVDTEDELLRWREWLKASGVRVTPPLQHELLESIYFDDPNGIQLEIARQLRPFSDTDARDARLTLAALADISIMPEPTVVDMWRRKADLVLASARDEI